MKAKPLHSCPACGTAPSVDPSFYNQVCIYCDNDDCQGLGDGNPQACGVNMKEAVEKWEAKCEAETV